MDSRFAGFRVSRHSPPANHEASLQPSAHRRPFSRRRGWKTATSPRT